jgi:hypothetical protein
VPRTSHDTCVTHCVDVVVVDFVGV